MKKTKLGNCKTCNKKSIVTIEHDLCRNCWRTFKLEEKVTK